MMQTMFVHLYNKQLKITIMKTYYLNRVNYSVIGTKKELRLFTELLGKCMNGRPATMSDDVVSELILSEKVTEKLNSVGFALEYTRLVKLNN